MRYVPRALLAGGLGLAAAFLAACGASSGVLLSTNQNNSLNADLATASQACASKDAGGAENAIGSLETEVANLPGSVDSTLIQDLNNGAQAVHQLITQQCNGTVSTATDTSSTPTTTPTVTHTTSTTTSTSTSTTTPTTTTPQTTTVTTPTTPTTPATSTPTPGTTPGGSGGATPPGGTGNTGNGSGN